MRTLLGLACLALASSCLTADSTCDAVDLGWPLPLAAEPAGAQSFCAQAPARRHQASLDAGPDWPAPGGCEQLYSFGELFEEGVGSDAAQCCLVEKEGVVIGKFVRFSF